MSEIFVDTIKNKAGSTSLDSDKLPDMLSGSAKAWYKFTAITTTALEGSFNISSITDGGTGLQTVNINNNMNDVNYSVSAMAGNNECYNLLRSETVGSFNHYTTNTSTAGTDFHQVCGQVQGDLA